MSLSLWHLAWDGIKLDLALGKTEWAICRRLSDDRAHDSEDGPVGGPCRDDLHVAAAPIDADVGSRILCGG